MYWRRGAGAARIVSGFVDDCVSIYSPPPEKSPKVFETDDIDPDLSMRKSGVKCETPAVAGVAESVLALI